MLELVREGGAGMLPVIVMGVAAISTSAWLAARPARTTLVLVVASALGSLLTGVLGTVAGLRHAAIAHLLDQELGHCLHPLYLSLVVLGIAGPLASIGAYRLVQRSDGP